MIASHKDKLSKFVKIAIEQEKSQNEGNSKQSNKNYHTLIKLGKEILTKEGGLNSLLELLSHENENVKFWSAYFLLKNKKNDAIDVLERISKSEGIISFNAEMTLEEYRAGHLQLQY